VSNTSPLQALTDIGVSIWLDDLSRMRLDSGSLADLVAGSCVRGVTSNPSIFEKAISEGAAAYAEDLRTLTVAGNDVDEVIRTLTTDDVRRACDLLRPVWTESGRVDGRVSIEVDPRLAHDTAGTVAQAKQLWAIVDRPNVMIKIPATKAGLPAISDTIAEGISVNVTLIFSVDRYVEVIAAYEEGLRRAKAAGHDLSSIQSVASFFVSRVDTTVDARLDELATPEAAAIRGKAAIANARLAWAAHLDRQSQPEWQELSAAGANPQRPLWASTGVKDKAYDDTRYVVDLAVDGCVNTMPEATLDATRDHGKVVGDTVTGMGAESAAVWDALAALGIDQVEVCDELEKAGVQSFIDAWVRLRETVSAAMQASSSA
jgi:transaldolase